MGYGLFIGVKQKYGELILIDYERAACVEPMRECPNLSGQFHASGGADHKGQAAKASAKSACEFHLWAST